VARPRKVIDEAQLLALCRIQCTYDELCAFFGVSERHLRRRYAPLIEKARDEGKMSLRRKMWQGALGGNVTLQIWISKNELGWTDRRAVTGATSVAVRLKTPEEVAKEIEEAAAKESAETEALKTP
jgi:RNA 3'-terminal phosphate cyclase